jgi:hypothetical protein
MVNFLRIDAHTPLFLVNIDAYIKALVGEINKLLSITLAFFYKVSCENYYMGTI